jgi:hypothetical protein
MSVTISLWLFGKPAHELNAEGEAVEPAQIRALAQDIHDRLDTVADALEKLTAAGWDGSVALYDIHLSHPYIDTEADARTKVEDLGLDPELFSYMEWEDEEEEMEEFGEDLEEG